MDIECILHRAGGTTVDIDGTNYHFAPRADGRHIATIEDEDHIGVFLAIPEGYRIAKKAVAVVPTPAKDPGSDDDALIVKHIGRGKFAIVRGDERVGESYDSKEEALAALEQLLASDALENVSGDDTSVDHSSGASDLP